MRPSAHLAFALVLGACFDDPERIETTSATGSTTAPQTSSEGSSSSSGASTGESSGSSSTTGRVPACEEFTEECDLCRCDQTLGGGCADALDCQQCIDAEICAAALACVLRGESSCCSELDVGQKAALAACRTCAATHCNDECAGGPGIAMCD